MKKFIITMGAVIFSLSAVAQQKSIITGSGADSTSYSKTSTIQTTTEKDITKIKEKAGTWNTKIKTVSDELEKSKNVLKDIISELEAKNNLFLEEEEDLGVNEHAKKDVPVCTGEKNRLKYENKKWSCVKPLTCNEANGGQIGWDQDPKTGKCIKPKAYWVVGKWKACQDEPNKADYNLQRRDVFCRKEGSNENQHFNVCSAPIPLPSRPCADMKQL